MEKRKIYRTGARGKPSYALVLPKEWVERIYPDPSLKREVEVSVFGDKLLVLPSAEIYPPAAKLVKEQYQPSDVWLEAAILHCYLTSIDRVEVVGNIDDKETSARIDKLRRKLSGFQIEERTSSKLALSFSTPLRPMRDILERSYGLLTGLHLENKSLLNKFPDIGRILDDSMRTVQSNEDDADQNAMLGKRLLIRALQDPEVSQKLGIGEAHEILDYHTIVTSLERLSDLETELFRLSADLFKRVDKSAAAREGLRFSEKPSEYHFTQYFDDLFRMVKDSHDSRDDPQLALKLLSTRALEYRPEYVAEEQRKKIISYSSTHKFSEYLVPLEGKIWAMSGIATNIAEAWLDMRAI